MLRYIIGISVLAVLIMITRRLSDGKILKKHQYALWLLIPIYMIVSPFLKINLPILEAPAVPVATMQTAVITENNTDKVVVEPSQTNNSIDQEKTVYPETAQNYNSEIYNVENKVQLNTVDLLKIISLSVSALIILVLAVYNVGFILYCRRKRLFIRQDQTCGLKIYALKHKSTPFLLFNSIYVDEKSDGNNEYIICHEACHYKHRDTLWIVLRYLVLALNWYNPIIWAAFFLSSIDCELACDEEAINLLGKEYSAEYAKSLYEILRQQSEVAFGFTVSTGMRSEFKTMKKRIASIKSPARKSYKVLAICMAILLAFSGCTLINPTEAVQENNTVSAAPFGDISAASVRLSNNGIVPCVFDADENTVKELAQAFNTATWEESDIDFDKDLEGEASNIFINNNGVYSSLCFRGGNYVRYQSAGNSTVKIYRLSADAWTLAWNKAHPEDFSAIQLIYPDSQDFTPEGVWKVDLFKDYPVYEVAIKGALLRSEPEVREDIIITGLKEGSSVTVLEDKGEWVLIYTNDEQFGYIQKDNLRATGKNNKLSISIPTKITSGKGNNINKIVVNSDAVLPGNDVLNQSYPATLLRSIDSSYQQNLLPVLLGDNYKKTHESDDQIQYESTDSSKPYRYVWFTKSTGNLWFNDAMVTGERGGEYQAPQMNMLPEESITLAQEKAAKILGQERVAFPSQSGLFQLHISLKDQATYERATREMDAHTHVFERRTDKNISILEGGVKVRIGVNGISDLEIDCSNYTNSGSDTVVPITLEEALTIASGICYNNETTVLYAELVYSNWCTENNNFNLSWHIVTNRGNYVVDCVTKTAKCDVYTY